MTSYIDSDLRCLAFPFEDFRQGLQNSISSLSFALLGTLKALESQGLSIYFASTLVSSDVARELVPRPDTLGSQALAKPCTQPAARRNAIRPRHHRNTNSNHISE